MHTTVLLLTATITPPAGVPLLVRVDPIVRMADYCTAFSFYLSIVGTSFDAIVFAENSSSDLEPLKALAREAGKTDVVEFISFNGLDHPVSYGRGFGEFKLVDHAMRQARRLQGDVQVWKCTGRYIVRNIAEIVRRRPSVDIYCHFRNLPHRLCDLYLMSFTRQGYALALQGIFQHLRNDQTAGVHVREEVAFRKLADAWPRSLRVARRFNSTPLVDGVRGWNNASYENRRSFKSGVRRVMQLACPWVWI